MAFIGGAFAYRAFEGTRVVTIREKVSLDSLRDVWLIGKVDSVRLSRAEMENARLREQIFHASVNAEHDTLTIRDTMQVLAFSADTVLSTKLHAVDGDGEATEHEVQVAEKVQYIPAFNLFRIEDLAISPILLPIRTKKVTEPTVKSLFPTFQFKALALYRDNVGIGGLVSIGDWGGGVCFEIDRKPMWMVSRRFWTTNYY